MGGGGVLILPMALCCKRYLCWHSLTTSGSGLTLITNLHVLWSVLFCLFYFAQDLLQTVFENGRLVKEFTFAEVRERAEINLVKCANSNKVRTFPVFSYRSFAGGRDQ